MSDRVPIEDPALLRKSHPLPPPPHADRPAEPGVIAGTLAWTASTLVGLPAATRQAAWEVAYMFGFNSTPIAKPHLPDTEPDLLSPHAAMGGSSASAHPPASEVPATNPVPPTLPEPETLAIANPAPPPSEEIDPGLLSNFVYDRSDRRPDGSYFVPKTLQRLFHVRTMPAKSAELPVIVKIAGRIIPDPQAHGTVQASVTGRIEPPDEGLPVLGGAVTKGQILGWVAPAVGVVDRTQVRREVARLTTDIRVEVEQLEILKQFRFVPFRDGKIYQAEQRIAGLRREREALLPLLQTREALRASSDGIISVSNAIVGQIVQAGDIVFQVIDPKRLWIEATAADPTVAAQASAVTAASAITPEGVKLSLGFVGSGLALKEQATPILFRIDNPPEGLRVGRPVTVTVQSDMRMRRGIPITRGALTVGSDGVESVWEQTAPEVFQPHPVRTQDVDGTTVLIVDSLPDGVRLVVAGARLLAQLQ